MTLVRGAARRAAGLPAGALLTAGAGPFELRTALFRLASDAATVSVWIRGIGGLRPTVSLSAGKRTLGTAIAGKAWRAVRVPVAALRGQRVALSVASANAAGLQLAYVGTVQRAPALRVRRFLPAKPDAPAGCPDRRRRDRLACAGRRPRDARAASRCRLAAHRRGALLKPKDARAKLTVKLPRARRGARRLRAAARRSPRAPRPCAPAGRDRAPRPRRLLRRRRAARPARAAGQADRRRRRSAQPRASSPPRATRRGASASARR